jgi:uncharacterized protein YndB with AHSA1/START domain
MKRNSSNTIIIEAARDRVWAALTDTGELNRWETTDAHLDLRVGGSFLYEYAYGPSRPGTFMVVDPPRRLVQDNLVFNDNDSYHYLNTIDLEDLDDRRTAVTVLLEGYGSGVAEQWLRESMDLGWATDLKVLKAYVEDGEDIRPVVWQGLRMGLRYVSADVVTEGQRGIQVLAVVDGAPAADAGLRPGDVVVALDDREFDDFRGFRALLSPYKPGDGAVFGVLRDGTPHRVPLTFGSAM